MDYKKVKGYECKNAKLLKIVKIIKSVVFIGPNLKAFASF